MILLLAIAVGCAVLVMCMWANQWEKTDLYRAKFEVVDELGKFQSDKADGLLAELEGLKECHKILLGEYDALQKDLEIKEESAKLRLDSIEQYVREISIANFDIAKLKAENAALKDWQPMKDKIGQLVSLWTEPLKWTPVTCDFNTGFTTSLGDPNAKSDGDPK